MKPTYQQYRSWGHGRFSAATLATPIEVFIVGAVVVGIILGIIRYGILH